MDPLTHALASLTLQRGFFPRAKWRSVLAIIFAGVIADVDWFSANFGPGAYLRWNRTATHSLIFVAALAIIAGLFKRIVRGKESSANWIGFSWVAIAAASALHILMDLLQAQPIAPLWPFSPKRFSRDLVPAIDPWLLAILAAVILLPELFRLVGDEIGSRAKRPRGRNGAIAGFVLAALYFATRALFHGNAVAALESRTIGGETPHRVAAFPDSASPFLWHGIVETESALHLTAVRSMGGEVTYATGVSTLHKPEPSAMLSAAQSSPAAITFLNTARFPKATIQKEVEGYSVEIQDLKDQAIQEQYRAVFADITLDKNGKLISSELQWQKSSAGPQ